MGQSSLGRPRRASGFTGTNVVDVAPESTSKNPFLLRTALLLFVIGLAAILSILFFPVFTDAQPPLWLYLTAMFATPLGFVLGLVFALMSGRRAR